MCVVSLNAGSSASRLAVDLIGRYVHEALHLRRARTIEQRRRADDVRLHERHRSQDRAIDVALGGEVNDRVDVMVGEHARDQLCVADVTAHELDVGDIGNGAEVACVGERVEHDEALLGLGRTTAAHEGRADETAATGDEQIHWAVSFSRSARARKSLSRAIAAAAPSTSPARCARLHRQLAEHDATLGIEAADLGEHAARTFEVTPRGERSCALGKQQGRFGVAPVPSAKTASPRATSFIA